MKKIFAVAVIAILFAPALLAQEDYSEGPIWRVTLARVKPNRMNEYLASLRQVSKGFLEEEKR